jgi:Domain of unknown function (DUF1707)/Cell wall-active antibiotics response 4TMS YvqF
VAEEEHSPPAVRVSDAERERTVARLRDAAVEGRLTLEELADRTDAAYGAVEQAHLAQLVDDLPAAPPAGKPGRRWFFAIMGGSTLSGRLRIAGRARIVNLMGGTDLDLSQTTLEAGELTLTVVSIMGGSNINVPHGVHVEHSGFALMGGDKVEGSDDRPPPDAPTIRIRSFAIMGGNDVRRGAPRPWRWSWQRHGRLHH